MPTRSVMPTRQEGYRLDSRKRRESATLLRRYKETTDSIVKPILKEYVQAYCRIPLSANLIPVVSRINIRDDEGSHRHRIDWDVPFGPTVSLWLYEDLTIDSLIVSVSGSDAHQAMIKNAIFNQFEDAGLIKSEL